MSTSIPPQLKKIQVFIKLAEEHIKRDPVIAYYCKLHALQEGMRIDKTSKECLKYLTTLMDELETLKKENRANEALTNDIIGQSYVEAYAIKLFLYADTEDRNANFNKNVLKAFFTAGILFDTLTLFGPLPEELLEKRKYAKWKSAYLNECFKTGAEPKPGPPDDMLQFMQDPVPPVPSDSVITSFNDSTTNIQNSNDITCNVILPKTDINLANNSNVISPFNSRIMATTQSVPFANNVHHLSNSSSNINMMTNNANTTIDPIECAKAEKLCKFAYSALQYQDIPTAITNLQQCLAILTNLNN